MWQFQVLVVEVLFFVRISASVGFERLENHMTCSKRLVLFSCLDVLHGIGSQPSCTANRPGCMSAAFTRLQSADTERHEVITGQSEQSAVQEKS